MIFNKFTIVKAIGIIHKIYTLTIKNSRKFLASTKTRSEVRGGGRKPWRQKGTGKARAGSIRSPLWNGGGVIFGPKPRRTIRKINKKEKHLALFLTLYLKRSKFIILKSNINYIKKTCHILEIFKNLKISEKNKILFILSNSNYSFWKSIKNLKNIRAITLNCLNVSELLRAENILLSETSLNIIHKNYEIN